jgi:hypothetical protein
MPTPLVNTRTFTGANITPPDGYVVTYSAVDGYYVPKPNSKIAAITSPSGAGPYTVINEDVVLVTHAGVFTVNLPVGPLSGYNVFIKDFSGNANTFNITVSSAALIDGSATKIINTTFGAVHVVFNGTTWAILSNF